MMKENKIVMRQIYTWILSAAIPLLASCTQDEFKDGIVPPGNSLYITSASLTSGGHTQTEAVTRASADDVLVPVTKGTLGIFRSQGTGYTSTLDNAQYTYTGADKGWQPLTTADTLFLNGDDVEVCAYYPHNSDTEFYYKDAIHLTSGKYTGTAANHDPLDICYATNRTLNAYKRATTFELKHAMALLELKITKDANYKGDCRITSVSIVNPDLVNHSYINITNGIYKDTKKDGVLAYNPGTDTDGILIGSATSTTAALLAPFVPTADGVTIVFAVNDVPVEAVIPHDKMPKMEAGHRYTANIVMKATSMQVTGVDMMPWEETGVGGDDYTWYPAEEGPPEHAITLENINFYVADGNVIATKQPDNTYKYAFAEGQGYFSNTYTGNDYFSWNAPDPTEYNDNPRIEWNPNDDVCSKIGDGKWYTPSESQLQELLDEKNIWGTYQMKSGVTVNGRYFGTDMQPSSDDLDKYVFLPASGYRMSTIPSVSADEFGYVWSSTISSSYNNAISFTFNKWNTNNSFNPTVQSTGYPVRCIRNK